MIHARRRQMVLFALVLVGMLVAATLSTGRQTLAERRPTPAEVSVKWNDLPSPVKSAISRNARGAQLIAFKQVSTAGKRVFRVEASQRRVSFALVFDRRGQLLSFQLNDRGLGGQEPGDGRFLEIATATDLQDDKDDDKDDTRTVPLGKVPVAVRKTLMKLARPAKLDKVEVEGKKGQKSYEASWKTKAGEKDATVAADGWLLETSEELTRRQLPAAVRRVASKIRNSEEIEFEKRVLVLYQIEYEQGDRESQIIVDARGQRVEVEYDDDDYEDDDDDDDDDKKRG